MAYRYLGYGFTEKQKAYFKKMRDKATLADNKSLCCNKELLGDGHCSSCGHWGMEQ